MACDRRVINFSEAVVRREELAATAEDEFFEREARQLGFKSYRDLEEASIDAEEAEMERAARSAGFSSFDEWYEHERAASEPLYLLIREVPDSRRWANEWFTAREVHAAFKARGFVAVGIVDDPDVRDELRGQLRFAGLHGPMLDGERDGRPVIRYETPKVFDLLSS